MTAPEIPDVVLRNLFDSDTARLDGTDPELVILTCGECGEEITGPKAGRGSAVMKLGTHRYTKHKIRKGDRPARPRPGAPSSDELAGEDRSRMGQVISLVKDVADGAGGGRVDRPPTVDELTRGFGRGLSISTVLAASAMAETDPAIPETEEGDRAREQLVDYLSLPQKAAEDVMQPLARMLAPTGLNRRYGRAVVRNVDVLGSFGELATLGMHWRRYLAARRAGFPAAAAAPAGQVVPFPTTTGPYVPDPAGGPVVADPTTPGPVHGRVIGPEDVARMQQQGRG